MLISSLTSSPSKHWLNATYVKCPTCDSQGFHNRFVPPFGPGSANCPLKAHKAIAKDIRKRVCAAAQAEGKEKFDMAYDQPHIAAAIAAAADE